MTIALAATFNPRGETGRLERYYPQMQQVFSAIVISLPPVAPAEDLERVRALPGARVMWREAWPGGRYRSLKAALESGADYYQYADLDRLIRWLETRSEEWLRTAERIQQTDCLVIGRTDAAWATHPQVMVQVEKVINDVFSFHLGQALDFGAGSKGFSRRAAELIVANSEPASAIGSDTEWPIICYRAGLRVEGLLVDGLDWEIPDQYQDKAADTERQRKIAEQYDADVKHWVLRVGTTVEAIECGLEALRRPLNGVT
jgi:hypothetical protein